MCTSTLPYSAPITNHPLLCNHSKQHPAIVLINLRPKNDLSVWSLFASLFPMLTSVHRVWRIAKIKVWSPLQPPACCSDMVGCATEVKQSSKKESFAWFPRATARVVEEEIAPQYKAVVHPYVLHVNTSSHPRCWLHGHKHCPTKQNTWLSMASQHPNYIFNFFR